MAISLSRWAGLLLAAVLSACSPQANLDQPEIPLQTALNRNWAGQVHCIGLQAYDWTEHWNLVAGKVSWNLGYGGSREIAWNGKEFKISGVRGSQVIDGTARFDRNVIVADFAFGTALQCHAKLLPA